MPHVPPLPMNAKTCLGGSPLSGMPATASEAMVVGRSSPRETSPENLCRLPLSCKVAPLEEVSPLRPTSPRKCPPALTLPSNRKAELVGKTSPLRQMSPPAQKSVSSSPLQSVSSRQWLRRDSPPAGSHHVCVSSHDELDIQDRLGSLPPAQLSMRSSLPASRPRWGVPDGWHESLHSRDSRNTFSNGERSSRSSREVVRSAIRQCSPLASAQRAVVFPTK